MLTDLPSLTIKIILNVIEFKKIHTHTHIFSLASSSKLFNIFSLDAGINTFKKTKTTMS